MKRITINLLLILLTAFLPLSLSYGQEKKQEQKLKAIYVSDGEKIVIDTTFKNGSMPDSILLKNGEVIHIGKKPGKITHYKVNEGNGNIYLATTTDRDGDEDTENVVVITGDNVDWTLKPFTGTRSHVYIKSDNGEKVVTGKHVVVSSADHGSGTGEVKEHKQKSIYVTVDSDVPEENEDVTKYILAKDGMVITIESNDEEKVKEIVDIIENKLDAKVEKSDKGKDTGADTRKSEKR